MTYLCRGFNSCSFLKLQEYDNPHNQYNTDRNKKSSRKVPQYEILLKNINIASSLCSVHYNYTLYIFYRRPTRFFRVLHFAVSYSCVKQVGDPRYKCCHETGKDLQQDCLRFLFWSTKGFLYSNCSIKIHPNEQIWRNRDAVSAKEEHQFYIKLINDIDLWIEHNHYNPNNYVRKCQCRDP